MVTREILPNKPLVEAIFEIKWKLKKGSDNTFIDENFHLIPGILYSKISDEYPEYVSLPTSLLPPEIAGYTARYQFRKSKDGWPLVQIGPGILSVNDTESYVWEDFEKRITDVVLKLFSSYTQIKKNIEIESLMLRYIDAIPFNYTDADIFEFLKTKLKLNIEITPALFSSENVQPRPSNFNIDLSYPSKKPAGIITIKFTTGHKFNPAGQMEQALIWNTMFRSETGINAAKEKEILDWVKSSHSLINEWFFTLIEGDLIKQFR